jgi:hypothetical protein
MFVVMGALGSAAYAMARGLLSNDDAASAASQQAGRLACMSGLVGRSI